MKDLPNYPVGIRQAVPLCEAIGVVFLGRFADAVTEAAMHTMGGANRHDAAPHDPRSLVGGNLFH